MQLTTWSASISQAVLIDSGADANFMDSGLARRLGLSSTKMCTDLKATSLDGRTLWHVSHQTSPVQVTFPDSHVEEMSFFEVTSLIQPLILGYPWLRLNNPSIDWSTGNIKFRSEFCRHNCQPSGSRTGTKETLLTPISLATEYPDLSKVPGLQARATSLPPHRPYGSD